MHPAILKSPFELGLGSPESVRLPAPGHPAHDAWLEAVRAAYGKAPSVAAIEPAEAATLAKTLREKVGTLGAPRIIAVGGPAGGGRTSIVRALGELGAANGLAVAALDCDLNHPGLLRAFNSDAPPILLDDLVLTHPAGAVRAQSLAAFWPGPERLPWHGRELERVLERFREDVLWGKPDIMLLDLPAIPDERADAICDFFSAEYWEVTGPTKTRCPRREAALRIVNAVPPGVPGLPYLPAGEFFGTLRTRLSELLPPSWTKGLSSST